MERFGRMASHFRKIFMQVRKTIFSNLHLSTSDFQINKPMKRNRAVPVRFSLPMMLVVAAGSLLLVGLMEVHAQQQTPERGEPRSGGQQEPQADLRVNVRLVN